VHNAARGRQQVVVREQQEPRTRHRQATNKTSGDDAERTQCSKFSHVHAFDRLHFLHTFCSVHIKAAADILETRRRVYTRTS
jgi:hypothetical protein